MTSTIIIPRESKVSLSVPSSFIGKQIEVTFTLVEEPDKQKPVTRLSEMFRGALSKESAESLNRHIKTLRNEWNDI